MIKSVHLERFKRFEELELPIGRLTVLTGANGAGKTSVIHALLLARQAARTRWRKYVELNGVDSLELGEASDIIHRQSGGDSAVIEVTEAVAARWILKASSDERSLNATVSERPQAYRGVLMKSAPRFTYLCAERFGPRDVLHASSTESSRVGVGTHGEYTAQVLAASDRFKVSEGRAHNATDGKAVRSLLHQTEAWMSSIVRPVQLQAEWFPSTSVTRLQFKTPGIHSDWMRPPNMGFGVSYALPIVVAALRAPRGGILIVENPEAHLHPGGQSGMGGFLARVAGDGVQVLVETHSDHMLNGIRTALADGSASLQPEDTEVHFFRGETDPGETVESIRIERTGQLSAWPTGFFDQAQRDLAYLARAKRSTR